MSAVSHSSPQRPAVDSDWQPKHDNLTRSRLFVPLTGLAFVLIGLAAGGLVAVHYPEHTAVLSLLLLGLLIVGGVLFSLILYRLQRHLMTPLAHLRDWAQQMRGGNLSARIPVPVDGEFAGLAPDINSLGEWLEILSVDMDTAVMKQTERIAQKTRSLEVLYDVAATINVSRDLDDLLSRFLRTMKDVVNARAGCVRLLDTNGAMRLVASIGLDAQKIEAERFTSTARSLCQENGVDAGRDPDSIRECGPRSALPYFDDPSVEMIAVPLQYRGNTLGVYNMFIDKPGLYDREDVKDLLTSIGRHLGMAIEKAHMDSEARQLTIMQERARLANELHDSLAQTLASLRFQVRVLDEALQQTGGFAGIPELEKVENSLDEAYSELRELIAHFRAPMDGRGLLPSIEALVTRFRNQTGIAIFLQHSEWKLDSLPPNTEMHVLRIVQESLANIRKHSHANNVRVMLRNSPDGRCQVLVEDDGIGMGDPILDGPPGEHIGLSIMRERAASVGGELRIESEPGEGTSIELTFNHQQSEAGLLSDMHASC